MPWLDSGPWQASISTRLVAVDGSISWRQKYWTWPRGKAVSDFQSENVRQVVPGAKNGLSARVMLLSKARLDDGGDRWVCQNEYGSPLNHLNH